jgi:hypothetical protein
VKESAFRLPSGAPALVVALTDAACLIFIGVTV